MGKLTLFTINLKKDVLVAGETVEGQVVLELSQPLKMRGIHLRFWGEARVRWTETHGSGEHRQSTTYTAHEGYYDQHLTLFGKPQGKMAGDNPELPAGHYEYPFAFQLPATLPPSAEFQHGRIRHQLKATIDLPWQIDDTFYRPFTVISLLDLNFDEIARLPTQGSKQKELGCCCCIDGEIAIDCHLDRAGYVPGEYIVPKGRFENNSSRVIDTHTVRLVQEYSKNPWQGSNHILPTEVRLREPEGPRPQAEGLLAPAIAPREKVKFHARRKTRVRRNELAKVVHKVIQPFSSAELDTFNLLIPPCVASGLGGCRILEVNYFLEAEMDPSGPSFDLELPVEITIGTVPLREVQFAFSQDPYNPDWHNSNCPDVQPPPLPSSLYPNTDMPSIPPPSYVASVGQTFQDVDEDKKGIEHGTNFSTWTPAYTYYTWGSPHQTQGQQTSNF